MMFATNDMPFKKDITSDGFEKHDPRKRPYCNIKKGYPTIIVKIFSLSLTVRFTLYKVHGHSM